MPSATIGTSEYNKPPVDVKGIEITQTVELDYLRRYPEANGGGHNHSDTGSTSPDDATL